MATLFQVLSFLSCFVANVYFLDWSVQPLKKHRKRKTDASQRLTHKQMKKRRGSSSLSSGMNFGEGLGSSSSDEDDFNSQTLESDDGCDGYCACQYLNTTGRSICMKQVLASYRTWKRRTEGGSSPCGTSGDEDLSDSLKKKEMEIINCFRGMQLGEGSYPPLSSPPKHRVFVNKFHVFFFRT
jgi:hypothetical protein